MLLHEQNMHSLGHIKFDYSQQRILNCKKVNQPWIANPQPEWNLPDNIDRIRSLTIQYIFILFNFFHYNI